MDGETRKVRKEMHLLKQIKCANDISLSHGFCNLSGYKPSFSEYTTIDDEVLFFDTGITFRHGMISLETLQCLSIMLEFGLYQNFMQKVTMICFFNVTRVESYEQLCCILKKLHVSKVHFGSCGPDIEIFRMVNACRNAHVFTYNMFLDCDKKEELDENVLKNMCYVLEYCFWLRSVSIYITCFTVEQSQKLLNSLYLSNARSISFNLTDHSAPCDDVDRILPHVTQIMSRNKEKVAVAKECCLRLLAIRKFKKHSCIYRTLGPNLMELLSTSFIESSIF
jgi:hypothetical protein